MGWVNFFSSEWVPYLPEHVGQIWLRSDGRVEKKGGYRQTDRQADRQRFLQLYIVEERLKECGLTTQETRRLRGGQIEVFKILNGYENIDSNIFFRN